MTTPTEPAVEVCGLHIVRGGNTIVKGLNCRIAARSCTAILGPNGSGKTTLVRAITGQTFITGGTVRVLGETIGQTDIRTLRRRVGMVDTAGGTHVPGASVDPQLTTHDAVLTGFFSTVGLYDRPDEGQHRRATALLEQVGLAHRSHLAFARLSTGEQRRCMIARALVHMPELLILDEPAAGLDLPGREQVLAAVESILSIPQPPAVLMITHHIEELSPRTSQVLLIKNGQIVVAGPPDDVITSEALTDTFGCKVLVNRRHRRFWLEVLPEAWSDLVPGLS